MIRACLAIMCAVALGACEDEPAGYREAPEQAIRAPAVTVARLARDPSPYDGQTVRVRGKVDAVLDSRAFLLEDHGLLWTPEIPVVARTAIAPGGRPIAQGDDVLVIGLVHARVTPELVGELAPAVAAAIGSGPVLLARSIRRDER